MAARWKIICAFMTLWYYCSGSTFPVPLLMWSSKSLDVDDQILAGHTFSYEDVQDRYLDKLNSQSNTVCVFVQDKLSIDDFAAHQSDHLKHLKQVLTSSATSIILPSARLHSDSQQGVTNRLVKYFEENSQGKILSLTADDAPDFPSKIRTLKSDGPNIIIVHLPKSEDEEGLGERNLMASDEVIGKLTDELSKYVPDYIGLLTAEMPRQDIMTGMEEVRDASTPHVRLRRAAKPDIKSPIPCAKNGIFVINKDIMFYLGNITLELYRKSSTIRDSFQTNTSVILTNGLVENVTEGRIMLFNQTGGSHWWCLGIQISGTLVNESIDASYNCTSQIDTPIDKSYACNNLTLYEIPNLRLTFIDLQVQPFEVEGERFFNAYHCTGFFTAPIWMGLISVGVLIAILYGGVLSLLSIKSMDRFDNPKDPTIVIQINE